MISAVLQRRNVTRRRTSTSPRIRRREICWAKLVYSGECRNNQGRSV